jgi:hypothetical protein
MEKFRQGEELKEFVHEARPKKKVRGQVFSTPCEVGHCSCADTHILPVGVGRRCRMDDGYGLVDCDR